MSNPFEEQVMAFLSQNRMGCLDLQRSYGMNFDEDDEDEDSPIEAAYVRFHPRDDPDIYPKVILTHPDTYEPHKDWLGRTIWWGVEPVWPEDSPHAGWVNFGDSDKFMQRRMAGNIYIPHANGGLDIYGGSPEQQFVNRLVELQIEKLSKMDLGDLQQRDYMLRIRLDGIKDSAENDRIWRRFRVSGGLSIAALSDKVLTPLMGWTRNYHAHAFTVYKDGAVYADPECQAVDSTHLLSIGYGAVPETSEHGVWTLAHLLQAEGEEMVWLHDFGDRWTHMITVEEIAPASSSTSAVAVLDGAGACPREDGRGNHVWAEDITTLASRVPSRRRNALLAEIRDAMNYRGTRISDFDPDAFDLVAARERVCAALASPDSVSAGAKAIMHVMHPGALDGPNPRRGGGQLKRGQVLERTWDKEDVGSAPNRFMEEVTTTRRDKKSGGCCWNCGSPHNLAGCSRCHRSLYCGKACQREHWKNGHRQQCKAAKQ